DEPVRGLDAGDRKDDLACRGADEDPRLPRLELVREVVAHVADAAEDTWQDNEALADDPAADVVQRRVLRLVDLDQAIGIRIAVARYDPEHAVGEFTAGDAPMAVAVIQPGSRAGLPGRIHGVALRDRCLRNDLRIPHVVPADRGDGERGSEVNPELRAEYGVARPHLLERHVGEVRRVRIEFDRDEAQLVRDVASAEYEGVMLEEGERDTARA